MIEYEKNIPTAIHFSLTQVIHMQVLGTKTEFFVTFCVVR